MRRGGARGWLAAAAVGALVAVGCAGSSAGEPVAGAPTATATTDPDPGPSPAPPSPSVAARTPRPDHARPVVALDGEGVHEGTLDGPDGVRTFRVHVPAELDADAPLLVALHPFTQNGRAFEELTSLAEDAVARGIVTVSPDGIGASWNAAETCCPPATRLEVDDIGFLRALVAGLREELDLDPGRTWAAGFSNGGFMALRLACEAGDVFTAVVSHAGTMDRACAPSEPVSVLVSHGAEDTLVPFEGGDGPVSPQAEGRGARDVFAAWRALDGCPEPAPRTSDASEDLLAAPCAQDTAVGLAVWDGTGHAWPRQLNALLLDWLAADADRRA